MRYRFGRTRYYPYVGGIDLRKELHGLLYGLPGQPPVGRPVLLRRFLDQACVCYDAVRGSSDPNCLYCQGEGWQFAETMETAYIGRFMAVLGASARVPQQGQLDQFGYMDEDRCLMYFEHTVFPDYERYTRAERKVPDAIYELKLNPDGSLYTPLTRTAKWLIRAVIPHHGDFGRIEFFEVGCEKVFL